MWYSSNPDDDIIIIGIVSIWLPDGGGWCCICYYSCGEMMWNRHWRRGRNICWRRIPGSATWWFMFVILCGWTLPRLRRARVWHVSYGLALVCLFIAFAVRAGCTILRTNGRDLRSLHTNMATAHRLRRFPTYLYHTGCGTSLLHVPLRFARVATRCGVLPGCCTARWQNTRTHACIHDGTDITVIAATVCFSLPATTRWFVAAGRPFTAAHRLDGSWTPARCW